jgi:hypothetical protein
VRCERPISINVMRPRNLAGQQRSFESPACGAFTLSQRITELSELFSEATRSLSSRTVDELR